MTTSKTASTLSAYQSPNIRWKRLLGGVAVWSEGLRMLVWPRGDRRAASGCLQFKQLQLKALLSQIPFPALTIVGMRLQLAGFQVSIEGPGIQQAPQGVLFNVSLTSSSSARASFPPLPVEGSGSGSGNYSISAGLFSIFMVYYLRFPCHFFSSSFTHLRYPPLTLSAVHLRRT
ncbi:uncharacterized protein LACBIDRAFT_310735 [Laccaria bicolor S238N-H82]|uniref:Predicted protein n=1 Tax=Laccaria bicolor (strain S238N-H82 / ATCC MYA-4686) TaxID=486041 RepID=B0DUZ9_LACBS|nr:uncharacterized protein LACBIDRAFT_310735 [Laccaria bicolor S238N-H82]EDR01629.1 predicted protein [Laccaria bicolor S238N-H82]|eukprot:XP_001887705.1 predicted protein [Laccaria bicolor S238N-H82]